MKPFLPLLCFGICLLTACEESPPPAKIDKSAESAATGASSPVKNTAETTPDAPAMDPAQHPQTALETFWRETFEGDTALAANLVYMPSEISVRGVSRQKFAQNLRQCLQNIQTHVQNQTPKPAIRVEIPDVRASAEQLTAHVYISLDGKEDRSMVIPMLKTMSGWRVDSYDALKCQEQPYDPEKAVKIFAEALMNDDLDTAILYVQPNDSDLKVLEKKGITEAAYWTENRESLLYTQKQLRESGVRYDILHDKTKIDSDKAEVSVSCQDNKSAQETRSLTLIKTPQGWKIEALDAELFCYISNEATKTQ